MRRSDDLVSNEVPSTVAAIALPEVAVDQSRSSFIAAVRTSAIAATSNLVGFQGDFTFDERVVTFAERAGAKRGSPAATGTCRGTFCRERDRSGRCAYRPSRMTSRRSQGRGRCSNLKMIKVGQGAQGTPLIWAAPPDQFIFIDADLNTQKAGNAAPGSATIRPSQRQRVR